MSCAITSTLEKTQLCHNTELKPPPLFSVIYLNDDHTSFEFVIATLVEIFAHSVQSAQQLAQQIHDQGQSLVAQLPHELAEQKALEVRTLAQLAGFPLQLIVQKQS